MQKIRLKAGVREKRQQSSEEKALEEGRNDLAEGLTGEALMRCTWHLAEPSTLGLATRPPWPGKSALHVGCQHSETPHNYLAVY